MHPYPFPVEVIWTQGADPGYRYERRWYRAEEDLIGALRHFDKLAQSYRVGGFLLAGQRIVWC